MDTLYVMYEKNYGTWEYPTLPDGWTHVATDAEHPAPNEAHPTVVYNHEAHFQGRAESKHTVHAFLEDFFNRLKHMGAIKEFKVRSHYLPYTH